MSRIDARWVVFPMVLESAEACYDGVVEAIQGLSSRPARKPSALKWLAGIGAGAVVCAAGYVYYQRLRRKAASDLCHVTAAQEFLARSEEYEPQIRDAVEGEQPDFTVVEVTPGAPDEDGPPGLARTGAARRVAKKKYQHTTSSNNMVNTPYLAEIVQTTRLFYSHRVATPYTMALAKGYMVRLMTEHGMRPSHISAHIDHMVNAVFVVTDDQLAAQAAVDAMTRLGRFGGRAQV